MKDRLRPYLKAVARNDWSWGVINAVLWPFVRPWQTLQHYRQHRADEIPTSVAYQLLVEKLVADAVVVAGPFQGMRYAEVQSVGSALFPKLLGTYEQELKPAIDQIIGTPYTAIVDIGCAEGYYAVGLAMRFPGIPVFAFDTDPQARYLCSQNALLNGVAIEVHGLCDRERLLSLPLGHRALIVMDCEGYETRLLDRDVVGSLSHHDFLVESHDCVAIETTQALLESFRDTHDVQMISSVDDIDKAYGYQLAELEALALGERKILLSENRPTIMKWLFARSRSQL